MTNPTKKDKLRSKSKTYKNPATLFITNLILPGTYNFLILIRNMEKNYVTNVYHMHEAIVHK